ncbi:hypothetical protein GCM10027425_12560 [Alteromonas gracilis]
MSRPWARHYQDDWHGRAGDPRMPYWLRVAALAYGSHAENGHARFKRGEISLILGAVDTETGEFRRFTNVAREIGRAVEFGWLEDGSYWGCLIVPAHSIRKGELGRRPKPCPLTAKHRRSCANSSPSEGFGATSPTSDEGFEARTAHQMSGSQRKAPLSDLYPGRQARPTASEASA